MAPKRESDEALLDARINANRLEYPEQSLIFVALITSFQPVYFSHAINGFDWRHAPNLVLYLIITGFTTYMLRQAYVVMVQSEFWGRQRHFAEVSDEKSKVLRRLRLQVAVGYSLFFLNSVFFVVSTCLMAYIFRHSDPRASYILSPTLTAALLWLIAQKNEESRQRRMRLHK
ncbi:hypothetical protein LPMP_140250 [Leishmania panamensis]|uniref:Uncharacterized protein n=4 Tax=Viannia TaxID=37616 RepID=A0A088RKS3_LEIPA|nr:hypothetical protein LPMP_140250 [Leishmania panamensis]AIN96607.1 hypothetical protein LPMP_140250 [Leishmania panamensis]CCM13886.1 hypothetical protein, conserved [Leishmania guyanensis]